MPRVFDCFTFFNELDILEIRLNELWQAVDVFVLVEAPVTFKGSAKPLLFEENKERFSKFLPRIKHIVINDMPSSVSAWTRETFQREAIRRGLDDLGADDTVIISDADEIMKVQTIESIRGFNGYTLIDMQMSQFYLNLLYKPMGWDRAFAISGAHLHKVTDFTRPRAAPREVYNQIDAPKQVIKDAGWHFTYMGGASAVRTKLAAYSHAGDLVNALTAEGGAENHIKMGRKTNATSIMPMIPISSLPAYVKDNESRFIDLGYIISKDQRIRDLEEITEMAIKSIGDELQLRIYEKEKIVQRLANENRELRARLSQFSS